MSVVTQISLFILKFVCLCGQMDKAPVFKPEIAGSTPAARGNVIHCR